MSSNRHTRQIIECFNNRSFITITNCFQQYNLMYIIKIFIYHFVFLLSAPCISTSKVDYTYVIPSWKMNSLYRMTSMKVKNNQTPILITTRKHFIARQTNNFCICNPLYNLPIINTLSSAQILWTYTNIWTRTRIQIRNYKQYDPLVTIPKNTHLRLNVRHSRLATKTRQNTPDIIALV